MTPTRTYLLIEKLIGEPLDKYLQARRDDQRSWGYIARELEGRTGTKVNSETLRLWHLNANSERVA